MGVMTNHTWEDSWQQQCSGLVDLIAEYDNPEYEQH